jgi:hypothetical protein
VPPGLQLERANRCEKKSKESNRRLACFSFLLRCLPARTKAVLFSPAGGTAQSLSYQLNMVITAFTTNEITPG